MSSNASARASQGPQESGRLKLGFGWLLKTASRLKICLGFGLVSARSCIGTHEDSILGLVEIRLEAKYVDNYSGALRLEAK